MRPDVAQQFRPGHISCETIFFDAGADRKLVLLPENSRRRRLRVVAKIQGRQGSLIRRDFSRFFLCRIRPWGEGDSRREGAGFQGDRLRCDCGRSCFRRGGDSQSGGCGGKGWRWCGAFSGGKISRLDGSQKRRADPYSYSRRSDTWRWVRQGRDDDSRGSFGLRAGALQGAQNRCGICSGALRSYF